MAKVAAGVATLAGAAALFVINPAAGSILATKLGGGITLAHMLGSAGLSIGSSLTLGGISEMMRGGPGYSGSLRQPAASRQVIYGQCRVSGVVVYTNTTGHQLNQVIAWASHPIQSIDAIYLDGREVVGIYNGNGDADGQEHTDVNGVKYKFSHSGTHCQSSYGTPEGVWFDSLNGQNSAYWAQDCKLRGIAATYVKTTYDSGQFSSPPNTKATIHGKNDIYDPRLGNRLNADGTINAASRRWTDNWALCVADFLVNQDYGVGCSWDEIDIDQLIAAANISDEAVPLAGSIGQSAQTITAINITSNDLTLTTRDEVTVQIDGNGYGAAAEAVVSDGGTLDSITVTNGGSGYTYATVTIWVNGVESTATAEAVLAVNSNTATEKRYTINGSFDYSSAPGDTLQSMLMAAEGRITYTGGKFKLYPAAWYGTNLAFDDNDVISELKWSERKLRDRSNAVRATYISPCYPFSVVGYDHDHPCDNVFNGQWQPTDAPEYAQDKGHGYDTDANLAEDNNYKLYADRRYQFVTSAATCQRLMKIYLLRNRQKGSGSFRMNLSAYQTQAQDVIQMTLPELGWTNKYLEVQNFRFVPVSGNGDEAPYLCCEIDVCETNPAVYSWSLAEERTPENADSPAIANFQYVDAPTGLALSSSEATALVGIDGITTPRILASWAVITDPFVASGGTVQIQYQLQGASSWTSAGEISAEEHTAYIGNVVSGQIYNVRIRALRANGAYSDWVEVDGHTVATVRSVLSASDVLLTDTTSLQTALSNISSDNVLSSGEKSAVITDVANIQNEQSGIDSLADFYGLSAEKTAYDTAVSALNTYLATLTSPVAWSDTTGSTTVDGATFRSKFEAVYSARTALANKASSTAKSLADTAKNTADTATTKADNAQNTANTAQNAADNAQNTASQAQSTATAAQQLANAALGKVTVVSSMPAASDYSSKFVYLTAASGSYQAGLYYSNGSTWSREKVTSSMLVDQIVAGQIASGAVTADAIAANAITTDKLAANSITATKISFTAADVKYSNGATIDSLKPACAGADVTSQNTAANTSSVGSRSASEVQSTIQSGGGIDFTNGLHSNTGGYKNSSVSIGSNGALSGAGGGQVTIGGLGFSGDLNATNGATLGTNLKSSGGTVLSDAAVITSQGTAAAIANQGALATKSNITSTELTSECVQTPHLAANSVTAAKILAGSVTSAKLTTGSLVVGGNGWANPGTIDVYNSGGGCIGHVGGNSGGTYGAWFQTLGVGGSSASSPNLYADSSGNLHMYGGQIYGPNGTAVDANGNLQFKNKKRVNGSTYDPYTSNSYLVAVPEMSITMNVANASNGVLIMFHGSLGITSNDGSIELQIKRDGYKVGPSFWTWCRNGGNTGLTAIYYDAADTGLTAGSHTYNLYAMSYVGNGTAAHWMGSNRSLTIVEMG